MRKLVWLLVVFVAGACSDGGTGPSDREGEFTADASTYAPYAAATLSLSGPVPARGAVVEGTLGTVAVRLVADTDSTLSFIVPGTVSGTQTLSFTTGSVRYSGDLAVATRAPIADPDAYIAEAYAEAEEALTALEAGVDADTVAGVAEMLAAARDSMAVFEERLAQMSAEERAQLAAIIRTQLEAASGTSDAALAAGVVHGTANLRIPSECRERPTAFDKYTCTWGVFGEHTKNVAIYLGAALLVAETTPVTGPVGMGVTAVISAFALIEGAMALRVGGELVWIHGLVAWEIGVSTYEAGSEFFRTNVLSSDNAMAFALAGTSSLPPSTMTTLTRDVPVTFTFQPQARRVESDDNGLGLGWLSNGLRWLAKYNHHIARYAERFMVDLAPPSTALLQPVPASQIAIEVVSGNVQLESAVRVDNTVTMRFTTTATTEQDFTYDVIYSSGIYPAVRVRHEAVLHPPSLRLANEDGLLVSGEVGFMDGVAKSFELRDESGAEVSGLNYSLVSVRNVTNAAVTASAAGGSAGFDVTLDTDGDTPATTSFDVYYNGQPVQTVAAVVNRGNPPVITSVTFGCSADNTYHQMHVSYQVTNGPPFDPLGGGYYGAPYDGTYPVRLEFLTGGTWQHASNSYSLHAVTGDGYTGTATLQMNTNGYAHSASCRQDSYYNTAHRWFDGWRIYLVDRYGQESNYNSFDLYTYTHTPPGE